MPISIIAARKRWLTLRLTRIFSEALRPTWACAAASAVAGSPSCPLSLAPQVKRKPLVVSAALWRSPAASCLTGMAQSSVTRAGAVRSVWSLTPSCPWELRPQAKTWEMAVTHRVW